MQSYKLHTEIVIICLFSFRQDVGFWTDGKSTLTAAVVSTPHDDMQQEWGEKLGLLLTLIS